MNRLFCSMICSDTKLDSHHYKEIIDEAIAEGELKTSKAYQKWAKKVAETEPPTDPLVRRQKLKKQEGTDIVEVISQHRIQRKQQLNSMLSSIVAKCGTSSDAEPSEEEFQKARQRLEDKDRKKRFVTSRFRGHVAGCNQGAASAEPTEKVQQGADAQCRNYAAS